VFHISYNVRIGVTVNLYLPKAKSLSAESPNTTSVDVVARALVSCTSSSTSRDDSDSGVDDCNDRSVVGKASVESTADCNTNTATHAKTARPHAESDIFLVATRKCDRYFIMNYNIIFNRPNGAREPERLCRDETPATTHL